MGKPSRSTPDSADGRFRLDGPSHSFDPRVDAIRLDLADIELASRHFAPHYAKAVHRTCIVARTPVRTKADLESEMISELLFGEGFALLDVTGGWAWGYTLHDHYVGYVPADTLGAFIEPEYRTIEATTLVANDGSEIALPVGARLAGKVEGQLLVGPAGAVAASMIEPLTAKASDPVATAEEMLDTPYLWGGRSNEGVDCSGLVQVMLARAGIASPRDTDLQLTGLGGDVAADVPYQRGDIIYFPEHVGIMIDDTTLLHATSFYGKVVKEPLADLLARVEAEGHNPAILGRKRLI